LSICSIDPFCEPLGALPCNGSKYTAASGTDKPCISATVTERSAAIAGAQSRLANTAARTLTATLSLLIPPPYACFTAIIYQSHSTAYFKQHSN